MKMQAEYILLETCRNHLKVFNKLFLVTRISK